jgi:probable rRNA maturation factor
MKLNIFNFDVLKNTETDSLLSRNAVEQGYKEIFKGYGLEDVNIVFVELKYIQELNKQYRGIDTPTDVLSFNISLDAGEVYICSEYVHNSFKGDKFDEEIIRLIIHGTLHILGYDHKSSMNDNPDEEMFKLQEDLVVKYTKYVYSNRIGKSRKRV